MFEKILDWIKEWFLPLFIILIFFFLLNRYPIYLVVFIFFLVVVSFFINNKGNTLYALRKNFEIAKAWLKNILFKESVFIRLVAWYILLVSLNNFIIEPLTQNSKRVPYGKVTSIPEIYKGSWEGEAYNNDIISKLSIRSSKMTYTWTDKSSNDGKQIIRCKSPSVFYNFHAIEHQFENRFWYPVVDIILLPLIPETIFGSQYIYWSCGHSLDKETSFLSISEPSTELYWLSNDEIGIMLFEPYSYDHYEYDIIEYSSTLFSRKKR
ncbi:hypothetical protein [Leucothrix pacifica]|uniref:Uncharacterized protein n=1 Tax=Leucothrix pacifica TaxID=1247513 RepID=A0A317C1B5_9GAMM|nr:hypothetical protein [Leucothrix pacifica]PWQ92434.1 hypothetical protein DKW60_21295 [Leucothrix pacifica]